MQRWTSAPLRLVSADWHTAELEFEDLRHDGGSYTVRLFLNNPEVDERADPETARGYAGRFTIFAHGNCWGDEGHCEIRESLTPFDRRSPHPLTPINISVDVTDALKQVQGDQVVVTALAESVDPEQTEPLRFGALGLATYE